MHTSVQKQKANITTSLSIHIKHQQSSPYAPVLSVHHMARLVVDLGDPAHELLCVRDSGGQEHKPNFVWQQDNGFLPHNSSFLVAHVVDCVQFITATTSVDIEMQSTGNR
jgi:hypothetical protein